MSSTGTASLKNPANSSCTEKRNNVVINVDKSLTDATDDEIIKKNLQELMDKKNREERKANGRLVAVILASLVIFLAIYHAWIRKSGALAGALVPAVIMVSFAGWVVILTRRDRARRVLFERYLEEMASRHRQELQEKMKLKHMKHGEQRRTSNETILNYTNELGKETPSKNIGNSTKSTAASTNEMSASNMKRQHRKHRKRRSIKVLACNAMVHTTTNKHVQYKRPSIRQKLFGQSGAYEVVTIKGNNKSVIPQAAETLVEQTLQMKQNTPLQLKRNRLQRRTALSVPTIVRTSSAP